MSDIFTKEKRSGIMSRIKGGDTAPEKLVRSVLHNSGFRFRLHIKNLPGHPDIVLPRHRKIIFVHGCFWHGHKGCKRADRPKSNVDFWNRKIDLNIKRDIEVQHKLKTMGWDLLVVWQCQTKDISSLKSRLMNFMKKEKAVSNECSRSHQKVF